MKDKDKDIILEVLIRLFMKEYNITALETASMIKSYIVSSDNKHGIMHFLIERYMLTKDYEITKTIKKIEQLNYSEKLREDIWVCPKCKYTTNDLENKVCKGCGYKPVKKKWWD